MVFPSFELFWPVHSGSASERSPLVETPCQSRDLGTGSHLNSKQLGPPVVAFYPFLVGKVPLLKLTTEKKGKMKTGTNVF